MCTLELLYRVSRKSRKYEPATDADDFLIPAGYVAKVGICFLNHIEKDDEFIFVARGDLHSILERSVPQSLDAEALHPYILKLDS